MYFAVACALTMSLRLSRRRRRRGADEAALSDFAAWPLKCRVGENSPSLWPTMFSVTYTGMNFFPLCTASVCPTISGNHRRSARPRLDDFLVARAVHPLDLLEQMRVDERTLFQ